MDRALAMRSKWNGWHRSAVVASAIAIGAMLLVACGSTGSSSAKITQFPPVHVAQAIVPVVVQANASDITSRVRGATIRIVDTTTAQSVGSGTTGTQGIDLVRLATQVAPATLTITATGGRTSTGQPFTSATWTSTSYTSPHAVFVEPSASPTASVTTGAHLASTSSPPEDWACEASTTAGFAHFLGFNMGTIAYPTPNCPSTTQDTDPGAPGGVQLADLAGPVHAYTTGAVTDVIGIGISAASAAYSLGSGTSSSQQLSAIQQELTQIQSQLATIGQGIDSLDTAVTQISGQVNALSTTVTSESADPYVSAIKTQSNDVKMLVGDAIQILCPSGSCSPTAFTSLSSALATPCPPYVTDSTTCTNFFAELARVQGATSGDFGKVTEKLNVFASYTLGSAAYGSPPGQTAGIVQYAVEAGAPSNSEAYYQTGGAADARLDWAYYMLVTQLAQVSEAVAGSLGIGQAQPGSTSKHPITVTPDDVSTAVSSINPIIDGYLGAFPNFPDTAVMTTGFQLADADGPYMFAQQVGAVVTSGTYTGDGAVNFDLSTNAFAGSSSPAIKGQNGNPLTLTWSGGSTPIVMTPLGSTAPNAAGTTGTWQLLPSTPGATTNPPVPTMTAKGFQNWQFVGATGLTTSSQPDWNGSSVNSSANPLGGPLADLYNGLYGDNTPGQQMTANSGIAQQLLFPQGQTYSSSGNTGLSYYYTRTQSSDANAAVGIQPCSPAANTSCLLPTWLTTAVNATSNNPSSNTGVFDFNNGVAVDNQTVVNPIGMDCSDCEDGLAWLNTYGNWESNWTPDGNGTQPGIVSTLNGNGSYPSFNSSGRPVLFDRQQASNGQQGSNDCFYWNGTSSVNSAYGSGCFLPRLTSSEVLPAVSTSY